MIQLQCQCGDVRGHIDDPKGQRFQRLMCYCDDCQSYIRHLGKVDSILDKHGGTRIFQGSPARVHFDAGHEQIAALRLSGKGIMRWYTRCCRSPIGNTTPVRQIPFVGIIESFISRPASARGLTRQLGPIGLGVFAGDKDIPDADFPIHSGMPVSLLASSVRNLASWRLRGDHLRSPFFDKDTGEPVAEPYILTLDERTQAMNS